MKLAVMQPYVFPYIGYFQLIHAVDVFVFYDDVNYIKGGWINRNKMLLNGKEHLLTIPCIKPSPNKQINEIRFDSNRKEFQKLSKSIEQAYKKAPCFEQVFPLIRSILEHPTDTISNLAEQSVVKIAHYLEIPTQFKISSVDFPETKGMEKADRLVELCKKTTCNQYINPIGGKELYNKAFFKRKGIQLDFITSLPIAYKQFKNEFVPWLSIIDVLMFNNKEEINVFLKKYTLK